MPEFCMIFCTQNLIWLNARCHLCCVRGRPASGQPTPRRPRHPSRPRAARACPYESARAWARAPARDGRQSLPPPRHVARSQIPRLPPPPSISSGDRDAHRPLLELGGGSIPPCLSAPGRT
ncbi:hypothetical protein GUJ93_ZPchr0008g13346 [Zizania palustris]|uniref:Uncharacterized protein n=1 Tax=Zizania palustris TaxID=103762 RepID=A0A8J5V0V3_ZIZPA|nr:hypothetical protein GUJ93_ZPchr0008g13346 [Zizania palustris]